MRLQRETLDQQRLQHGLRVLRALFALQPGLALGNPRIDIEAVRIEPIRPSCDLILLHVEGAHHQALERPVLDAQQAAVTALMDQWSNSDAVSASQWLQGQAASPMRDAASMVGTEG